MEELIMESAVIVIALFAVIIIVVVVLFRGRIKAAIKGPGNTGLELGASNPPPQPGVQAQDIKSRSGGAIFTDETGRGAKVDQVDVEQDVHITSRPPSQNPPPK